MHRWKSYGSPGRNHILILPFPVSACLKFSDLHHLLWHERSWNLADHPAFDVGPAWQHPPVQALKIEAAETLLPSTWAGWALVRTKAVILAPIGALCLGSFHQDRGQCSAGRDSLEILVNLIRGRRHLGQFSRHIDDSILVKRIGCTRNVEPIY